MPIALSASFFAIYSLVLSSTMFVGQAAASEAKMQLGKRLVRIDHVGSFSRRNITRAEGQCSGHASVDVLDVADFRFSDGGLLTRRRLPPSERQRMFSLRTLFSASNAYLWQRAWICVIMQPAPAILIWVCAVLIYVADRRGKELVKALRGPHRFYWSTVYRFRLRCRR
ncbi:extensin family protein [Sodalis-like endosymbiont of Proechinophthirus fluctus]|uniref:extensin family protein n=1 Tax=Sodalis-like endosymbiont of Proechinophthirus fluctus TaxID=1462730 RepID=UPI00164F73A9|nr:extensin family protein [Sodalis-like endosymbiont of Proechinophthirus fluctus]